MNKETKLVYNYIMNDTELCLDKVKFSDIVEAYQKACEES